MDKCHRNSGKTCIIIFLILDLFPIYPHSNFIYENGGNNSNKRTSVYVKEELLERGKVLKINMS